MSIVFFFKKYFLKNIKHFEYLLLVIFFILKLFNVRSRVPENKTINDEIILKNTKSLNNQGIPNIIWIYWHEGVDESIFLFVNKIREKNPNYEVNFLTKENLSNYIENLYYKKNMPLANFSDLVRLELLYKYGGIWMDATIMLGVSVDELFGELSKASYDLLGFYNPKNMKENLKPVIESWFLASPKNNEFIYLWLLEMRPLSILGSSAFFKEIEGREDYEYIKMNISNPEYLLVYLTQQIVLKSKSFNLYLLNCNSEAFFYQNILEWNYLKINSLLCFYNCYNRSIPRIIKLTSNDRKFLPIIIKWKLYSKNSILNFWLKS